MIKAQHKGWAHGIFKPYLGLLFRKHFFALRIPTYIPSINQGKSVLLVANHFSWWDGFFWYYINNVVFKKRFHLLMLEEQLDRFWFFRYLGAFSVKKGSRSMVESLEYAAELLKDPDNLVLIFPQGEIQAQYQAELNLHAGVEHVWQRVNGFTDFYYGAVFTHYGSQPKPTAFFYIQPSDGLAGYNQFFIQSMQDASGKQPH